MTERKRSPAGRPAGADKRSKPVVDLVPATSGPVVAAEGVVEAEPVVAEPVEDEADEEKDEAD